MLFSSTASFGTAVGGKLRFPAAEQNSGVHPRDETLSGEAADCVAQLFISQVLCRYKQSIQKVKGKKKDKINVKNTDKVLVHTAVCSEMLLTSFFFFIYPLLNTHHH